MTLTAFKEKLISTPGLVDFQETISLIETLYLFTPTQFRNGELLNEKDQNNGSCKLFSFAKLQALTKEETLACFGAFYREEVLLDPDGTSHQNIRNFMRFGWDGIEFYGNALQLK